jgi:UDPglucose 6-dehydrogenase
MPLIYPDLHFRQQIIHNLLLEKKERQRRNKSKYYIDALTGAPTITNRKFINAYFCHKNMEVSIVGLGRLGSSFGASVAKSGIRVHGVDIDDEVVQAINTCQSPFEEPLLNEYIRAAGTMFSASNDADEAIKESNITFVFVNTYNKGVAGYALDAVESATRAVGDALATNENSHLFVLRSTVMPGDTLGPVVNWLEESSGRRVGDNLNVCYWPELTALGAIIHSMEKPEFRLIGEESPLAGDMLEAFIERWSGDGVPVVRTNVPSAEVAKMGINTYIAAKMSFANNLAQICEGIGADVDMVTGAMAHDSRINQKYFTAGVRYGGPCFPHDNIAFETLANRAGCIAPMASGADEINHAHTEFIMDAVEDSIPEGGTLAVLGMTYKPGVPVVAESQGIELLQAALGSFEVVAYDEIAMSEAKESLNSLKSVSFTDNLDEVVDLADTAVITLRAGALTEAHRYENLTLIDPWGVFDTSELSDSVTYRPIGRLC